MEMNKRLELCICLEEVVYCSWKNHASLYNEMHYILMHYITF